jgi:hypothetical protein
LSRFGRFFRRAGNTIQSKEDGIEIQAAANLQIDCSTATISSAMITVNCPVVNFSAQIKADTVEATSIICPVVHERR